ncbi:MAG: cytochrome-c oxidase, cbb3-type subunit I [Hyphomonas sp.]|uniref:cytochrome-c oxidase, cbb3-type subunit I n=1 Tax=Hyphomonas sp. TaxID=87 RepID=UPI0017E1D5DC|nr:cytochrome-c oxidase, cbb3-type subunit I [Hyphomonas sp.]MBA3070146.1 cytochrome-c oxidase, cbb3-type subunit I [Hyphomonas sp.]MBU3922332.1 cytochrome-c oxidase, cbb3-type subunit I [Alphaproteobacteria bacterium]MBU4060278.1 cytochrome-c oxidase, cbb3-type subunit I [Alphaproteobacteria bacterium]MBU4162946.1 cytochrome-c oxidase, cbb3-type subunit I [Alphaproteobacteria bacterium]
MSANTTLNERPGWGFSIGTVSLLVGAVAFGVLMIAANAADPMMAAHAWIFFFLAVTGLLVTGLWAGTLQKRNPFDPAFYEDTIVKFGVVAAMFWGIAGFLVGLIIALQLTFPNLFYFPDFGWTNFGRLRPLHTSAVIFAFGGNVLIATSFYVVQRTCRTRLAGGLWPWFVFWGYNLFICIAGTGYLLGVTQSKEYAEPEWYADLWLTIVWVAYLLVFLGTLWKRKEPHIYVANWFYLSFIVTIAMLHIVNNLAIPVSLTGSKSYQLFAGVQDALTQWWYGHNAVGFFLTTGFLAIMYYFIPKRVNRPVYSYRLSIVHFWSLIFIYIWAGPHHLHYTALPQWAQTLGMVFSVMLWMPSWGGMINGVMTLSGAWDKLRTDPVVRMMIVALAFYGMSTFEGPLMSVRAVNSLSHYTEWGIAHVHSGSMGWVGFISFGAIYCLVPWLWKRPALYSKALVEWHFWLATLGILFYIVAMYVAGIMEGFMWRAYNEFGFLEYAFIETVKAKHIMYAVRAGGGTLFLLGALLMAYNLVRTALGHGEARGDVETTPIAHNPALQPAE